MSHRQVDGIDADNFPDELRGHELLSWMGEDYVQFVASELLTQFRQQDSGTELVALKCEQSPRVLTRANQDTGRVGSVVAEFDLQVLLRASDGQHWRLKGDSRFTATSIHSMAQASVVVSFEIRSTELIV